VVPNADAITLLGTPVSARNLAALTLLVLVVAVVVLLLARFFGTNLGLALRATGDNPQMARALGVSVDGMIVVGLVMANGLIGLAGALRAGLDPNALKLVSAVFVFLALVVPGAVRRRFRRDSVSEGARG
jgi:ABC-type uncharacterized transport system permease subunit